MNDQRSKGDENGVGVRLWWTGEFFVSKWSLFMWFLTVFNKKMNFKNFVNKKTCFQFFFHNSLL